jgi:hypothetical protein
MRSHATAFNVTLEYEKATFGGESDIRGRTHEYEKATFGGVVFVRKRHSGEMSSVATHENKNKRQRLDVCESNVKPHVCFMCGKAFLTSSDLAVHMLTQEAVLAIQDRHVRSFVFHHYGSPSALNPLIFPDSQASN